MKPRIALALCAVLVACSSGGSTGPSDDGETGELVHYDAIAGSWSGWDYRGTYSFQVSIGTEAEAGEEVGTFEVMHLTDGRMLPYCASPLEARSASPPTYRFDSAEAGSCTPVIITFVHDPAEDRIEIINSNGESGYLIPGTDPGPPPE